ncbi:MAG: radical SAM protein [Oscillospiraceae bacterium]|nr:radical SAM protein [Oscillospiraceae bacterium]
MMEYDPTHCTLCPRQCGADRTRNSGLCGGGHTVRAARAALHFWEEPPISGTKGSGTVFFSGCPLHCRFCQNAIISETPFGKDIPPQKLCGIFLSLEEQGAHNINLVTAGHFIPYLVPVLEKVRPKLHIPIVYNSGGYELTEALRMLNGLVDIYLPDFKFFDSETAKQYAKAPDYPEIAEAALKEMLHQAGAPVIQNGLMQKGVIVRHLVLPGHRHESIALLRHLADVFGTDAFLLSLMSQFTPMKKDTAFPELNRRVTKMEYTSVVRTAAELGFQGFTQDESSAERSYTPDFALQGL